MKDENTTTNVNACDSCPFNPFSEDDAPEYKETDDDRNQN